MKPDDSTHKMALKTDSAPEAAAKPEVDEREEGKSKPSASERVASEAPPVQIQPDGR